MKKYVLIGLIIYVLLVIVTPLGYYTLLPSLPVFKSNILESEEVLKQVELRSASDEHFFNLTDSSVSAAFVDVVDEEIKELDRIIRRPTVMIVLLSLKYIINRCRPNQINKKIEPLFSRTANTPSYPAGHAFQAYYLANVLGKKYPKKKEQLYIIAEKCDKVRIKAGLHYPSDGEFSKAIVEFLYN